MSLEIVRGVVDTNMLGWEMEKKGTCIRYFPTVRLDADDDEGRVLLEKKQDSSRIKNGIVVKYLGVDWKSARKYDYIAASRWEPCSFGQESMDQPLASKPASKKRRRTKKKCKQQPLDDEGRLKIFLNHIKGTARFRDDPVDMKVEELAVRKIWEVVTNQQKEHELKLAQEAEQRATMEQFAPMVSQEESVVQEREEQYEESDDEYDNDDEGETGTPSLEVNDEVEFYDPVGVAGNPDWLRRTKILGIRPNHEYPLVFSDLIFVPRSHHVRKLPNGFYRAIESYQLVEQGEKNGAAGLNAIVSNLKRAREEVSAAADDFWKRKRRMKTKTLVVKLQTPRTSRLPLLR